MSKKEVTITIAGEAGTGKTTIMEEVIALLESINIEISADWGLEGAPSGDHSYRMMLVSKKVKVNVKMLQLRKTP